MTRLHQEAWLDADWPAPPGVRALTTTRYGLGVSQPPFDAFNLGARCGDDADVVLENRRQLETALQLPSSPRWLRQVHGVDVIRLDRHSERSEESASNSRSFASLRTTALKPEADAAITSEAGTVLAILTADCLPVVFAAKDGSEIAAAHAGWRGLAAGMLEATVTAMQAAPSDVIAWLGPCAGPQAYEIGQEVFDAFVAQDPRAVSAFVATRANHWLIDLYALARMRLLDAGIDAAHIHGGDLCTISDPQRFFSHRRDQRTGRMATLAWIERAP